VARITHPHPTLGTTLPQVGGVVFRDGIAEVDLTDKPNLRSFYEQHGYGIEEDVDLATLTVRELRDIADVEGVDVPAKAKKSELLELLAKRTVPLTADEE